MSKGLLAGVLVAILVIGGGLIWWMNDDNSEDMNTSTNASQMTEMDDMNDEMMEDEMQEQDIVALAAGNESLSTLVTAVQAADLVATLQGDGPFTVFAPTNAAFDELPDGTLESLLEPENQEQLAGILTYHVVSGEVMSSQLSDGQEIITVQGGTLTVDIRDGNVYIVDAEGGEAMVMTADVAASNGVVHVIDAVLMPGS